MKKDKAQQQVAGKQAAGPLHRFRLDRRILLGAGIGAVAAALAIYSIATLLLPVWIERTLKHMVLEATGSHEVRYEALRFNFVSAELDRLSIGRGKLPPLEIDSCSVKFTPLSLLKKRLDKVAFSGISLELASKGGRLSLNNAPLPEFSMFEGDAPKLNVEKVLSALGSMPFAVDCFEVRNAELNVRGGKMSVNIPFRAVLKAEGPNWSVAALSVDAAPNGQPLKLAATLKKAGSSVDARVWTPRKFQLDAIPFVHLLPQGSSIAGTLSANATLSLSGSGQSFRVNSFDAKAKVEGFALLAGGLSASSLPSAPLTFTASESDGKGTINAAGLRIGKPLLIDMKSLSSAFSIGNGIVSAEGRAEFAPGAEGSILKEPVNFILKSKSSFKGAIWQRSELLASLPEGQQEITLVSRGIVLKAAAPSLACKAMAIGRKANFEAMIETSSLKVAAGDKASLSAQEASVFANISTDGNISVEAGIQQVDAKAGAVELKIEGGGASFERSAEGGSGALFCKNASATDSQHNLKLDGITASLPFNIAPDATAPEGELAVASIEHLGRKLGSLKGRLSVSPVKGLAAKGSFSSALVEGLTLDFDSSSRLTPRGLLSKTLFSLKPFKLQKPLELGLLHPSAQGLSLTGGTIVCDGTFQLEGATPSGSLYASVKDASAKAANGLITAEGVDAYLKLPTLPELRSAPSQALSFSKARLGSLELSDGRLSMRLDAPGEVFIESFLANCCDGKVSTQSFVFAPKSGSYDVVLHCDRVSISKFLSQVGFGRAQGAGSLNGTVPLSIRDGGIKFHDAFLYSTPGEGGAIRIDDSGLQAVGLPGGEDAPAEAAIVRESLKNYLYSWAKLSIDTQGDEVEVKLQLDGRPDAPLPFRIEDGSYVFDSDHKLRFQGIRMDLNFKLPLAQVIGMGGELKKIFKPGEQ